MDFFKITEREAEYFLKSEGVVDIIKHGKEEEMKPKWDDLARLYHLVRERKPFEILEFGSGFSTLVMSVALKRNWQEYSEKDSNTKYSKPIIISIETSDVWQKNTLDKLLTTDLHEFANINLSKVKIGEYNGQLCHFYEELPNIVPDFVYLDGPDPLTVEGNINGLSFRNKKRTVMSGDILKYESTLLPGFYMIVDGRSNNARFLERMLTRNYDIKYHSEADATTFILKEDRLGKKNIYGWEAYS